MLPCGYTYYSPPQYSVPPMYKYVPYNYSDAYYNNSPYQYSINPYCQPPYSSNIFYQPSSRNYFSQQYYNTRQQRAVEQQRQTEEEEETIIQSIADDQELVSRGEQFVKNQVHILERFNNRNVESDAELYAVLEDFMHASEDVKSITTSFKTDVIRYAKSKDLEPHDKHYDLKKEGHKILHNHSAQAIEKIEDAYNQTFTKVTSRFQRIISWLTEKDSQVYHAVKDTFKSVWHTFKRWISQSVG